MKHIWLATKYTDSTEELLSIHATREGAILASKRCGAGIRSNGLKMFARKRWKVNLRR